MGARCDRARSSPSPGNGPNAPLTTARTAITWVRCGEITPGHFVRRRRLDERTKEQGCSALHRIDLPVKNGETVEGLVDVDGHDIYARCSGTGSPLLSTSPVGRMTEANGARA